MDACSLSKQAAAVLALTRSDGEILTLEHDCVSGFGSGLAEVAPRLSGLQPCAPSSVRGMLESGRSADDVLACLHLGVADIAVAVSDNLRPT